VPNKKLKRSPGANLKSSSGSSGIESYAKLDFFGILNRILLLKLAQEFSKTMEIPTKIKSFKSLMN
jgi:hypothetical protein